MAAADCNSSALLGFMRVKFHVFHSQQRYQIQRKTLLLKENNHSEHLYKIHTTSSNRYDAGGGGFQPRQAAVRNNYEDYVDTTEVKRSSSSSSLNK